MPNGNLEHMFDGTDTANFPTEPADLVAPEDLVDELAAILVRRDRDEARATQLLAQVTKPEPSNGTGTPPRRHCSNIGCRSTQVRRNVWSVGPTPCLPCR